MEIDSPLQPPQKEFSNKNVMCLLTDPEGTPLGAPISLPQSTGPIQLQELVNNLLKNEDKVPYAFYISDKELVVQLGTYLEKNKGHTEAVLCVSFSPDGRHLASGSGDTTVRLWDLNTQAPLFTCTGADTKMAVEEELVKNNDREVEIKKNKRKKRLLREAENAKNRGVCYFSRIPPRMDPTRFRQILSQYGEIDRIYLTPENPAAQLHRKRAGGFRGQNFSEGWVEFISKSVAKRVAHALNGEQIGGKKKSQFYYDLWNIKYLSKFKWDDLTEEIAYKMASREQKLALELSAATRERDFYLSKVDKSRALASIQERMKKKQKISEEPDKETEPKVIRHFPQTRPVSDTSSQSKKPGLSKEVLAGVFGGSF